jgi:type IV pilus assembly protein PilB
VTQPRIRIGDMLVRAGLLTQERLDEALALQRARPGRRLGDLLLELGFVDEGQLTQILSNQLSVPWVNLSHVDFTRALLNHVPQHLAEEHCLIPVYVRHVRKTGDTLFVAMDDPTDDAALAAVAAAAGMPARPMVAAPSEIATAIRVYYGGTVKKPLPQRTRPSSPGFALGQGTPTAGVARPEATATAPRSASTPPPQPTAHPPTVPQAPQPSLQSSPESATPPPATGAATEPGAERAATPPTTPATQPPATPHAPASEAPARPAPAARRPRMITLTLLDGTTVTLPAPGQRGRDSAPADAAPESAQDALTAADLVAALRAKSAGADVSDVLGDATWESMFAALLSVLLKTRLIADFEFVEEWKKHR